ncbi:MAG: PAS domain-containing protein, partial [Thermoanaerobaculaceae bacterium]
KIFMKDRNFRFVSINEKFAHDLGIRPEEAVGKADADFFPPELAAKYHEDDVRILETGKTEVLEERYLQEGRETWVSTIKTPVRDTNGEIVGVLGVFWDVTERKRAEEALQRQATELKARNEELMRFNDTAVGRELRMIELKQQVNELCGQLGKPLMYPLGFLDARSQAPIAAPATSGHEPTGET